ncbi:hypothetical protein JMJ77_0005738 [Colletotrichum scovillei]|uniref:Transmembrane protein n=1 Tax=Colletotrichum scovillei TaxID=1209932 RepID=A0A9P7UM84_9PEZI|nr:hypothetical protein JMJ77_0005738 [Colletotrichum scovillei]KAG7076991.1 hypothetical protein JMJ76_0014247 [Colletotrichum scovillei]KAG7084164.1 hypothetical protein JMJ78_0009603 [Colletotrichum scovillei]
MVNNKIFRYSLIFRPVLATVLLFRTQADLFNSMLGEIFWLWVILLWGTSKLFVTAARERWRTFMVEDSPQDTHWQFGQVPPMLLLAAPLMSLLSSFISESTCTNCRRHNMDTSQGSAPGTDQSQRIDEASLPNTTALDTAATSDSEVATDRTDNSSYLSPSVAVSVDIYSDMECMVPYLTSSLVVIGVHVYFLFRNATKTLFYMVALSQHPDEYPDPYQHYWLWPDWTPTEYMFTEVGVFHMALLSYLFAGHGTILAGLMVHDWASPPSGTLGYYLRFALTWLSSIVTYGFYTWIICWGVINSDLKIWSVVLVTVVLYGFYVVACLASRLKCFRWRMAHGSQLCY